MGLLTRIKQYYGFSPKEIESFGVAILVIAFIVSYKEILTESIGVFGSLIKIANYAVIVVFSLLVRDFVQKAEALRRGYRVEWRMSLYGLLAGLILCIMFDGIIFLLLPGGMAVYMMKGLRLGKFRYGLNRFEIAQVAMYGPIASAVLALIFKILTFVSASALLDTAIFVNVWLAIFTMLPIPPFDGSKIFFGSRLLFFFILGCIIGSGIFIYLAKSVLVVLLGSLLVGVVIWLSYLIFGER